MKIALNMRRLSIMGIVCFGGCLFVPYRLFWLLDRFYNGFFSLSLVGRFSLLLFMVYFFILESCKLFYLYYKGYSAELDEQGISIAVVGDIFSGLWFNRFITWPDIDAINIQERGRHGSAIIIRVKNNPALPTRSGFEKFVWYVKRLSYHERKNQIVLEYCKTGEAIGPITDYWKQYG